MEKTEIKYPATVNVHWVTSAVPCCEYHANALVKMGKFLGSVVPCSEVLEPAECANCVNEAKDN